MRQFMVTVAQSHVRTATKFVEAESFEAAKAAVEEMIEAHELGGEDVFHWSDLHSDEPEVEEVKEVAS